jgi:hypothetical protein
VLSSELLAFIDSHKRLATAVFGSRQTSRTIKLCLRDRLGYRVTLTTRCIALSSNRLCSILTERHVTSCSFARLMCYKSFKRLAQSFVFRPLDLVIEFNKRLAPRVAFGPALELSFELRELPSPSRLRLWTVLLYRVTTTTCSKFCFRPLLGTTGSLQAAFLFHLTYLPITASRLAPSFVFLPLASFFHQYGMTPTPSFVLTTFCLRVTTTILSNLPWTAWLF